MLATYRTLLATPGGAAFSAAGFLARLPISMVGLGIVLLVSSVTGSYGLAGTVAATFVLTSSVVQPPVSRLVDRLGQARILLPALTVHVIALSALVVAAVEDAPSWTLFATAAVSGAAMPNIGSLVRARWTHLVGPTGRLHTAYAFESVVDEMIFIVGPVLVTWLATQVAAPAGLAAAAAFALVGGLGLALQRGTEPPLVADPRGGDGGLHRRGLPVVVAVFAALGTVFGSMEVVVVAFATEQGHRPVAGVILALYAGGSLLAGLAYGARTWVLPLDQRFRRTAVIFGVSLLALPFVPGLLILGCLAVLAGLTISPTLITGFALVERLVPSARLTEGLTWSTTGIGLGVTAGAAIAGPAIDLAGAQSAFLVVTIAGLVAALTATAGTRYLRLTQPQS